MVKKNIWSLLGWIISISLSIYLFIISNKSREPTFIVDQLRPIIVDRNLLDDRPINITNKFGDTIKSNVRVITFYFFNQGEEAIRKENVLEPLVVGISNGKILDYKILKISREVTGLSLREFDLARGSIAIDFKILEKNDGFAGQIIVESDFEPDINIVGTIEGVRKIRGSYFETTILLIYMVPVLVGVFLYIGFDLIRPKSDLGKKRSLHERLTTKYQIVIRNHDNLAEKTTINFTYSQLLVVSASYMLIVFIISFSLIKILESKWKKEYPIGVPSEVRAF